MCYIIFMDTNKTWYKIPQSNDRIVPVEITRECRKTVVIGKRHFSKVAGPRSPDNCNYFRTREQAVLFLIDLYNYEIEKKEAERDSLIEKLNAIKKQYV